MKKYTIVPELIGIQTNVDCIWGFKFGDRLTDTLVQSENNKVMIEFKVTKDFKKPKYLDQKFHFFWGGEGIDELYYERPVIGSFKARLLLKNFTTTPKIFVNSTYSRWGRLRVESVLPPGMHLTHVIALKLLEKGYLLVHASAVSCAGQGIVIFAPPDTGKTITAFRSLNYGFKFLSEDIALTDGKYVYCTLTTPTYRDSPNIGQISKIKNKLSSNVPLLSYLLSPAPVKSVFEFIAESKIDKMAKIRLIYILCMGVETLKELTDEEAIRRILILNRAEFSYSSNPVLVAYSYFNRDLDLNKIMDIEKEIILKVIRNSDNYLVKANDPLRYIELIREKI